MMTLYAATTNPGKLAEFANSASAEGVDVLALPSLKTFPEPIEDAPTFMGNAEIKAIAYSLASPGLLVFADDSGLEVDALNGAPGVRSARFADDHGFDVHVGARTDERNNDYLVFLLERLPFEPRTAHFVCALALARGGEVLLRAHGRVHGEMILAPRGTQGFGYDPLFFLPALGVTMAELPREEKWQISHRGDAFRSLLEQLRSGLMSNAAHPQR
ncbi:MAG: non-canonical purine NTP pyrophosphatase [Acidobacteriaceae bacterium]